MQASLPTTKPVIADRSGELPSSSVYSADTTTLPPGTWPHASSRTSKTVAVASRSAAEKVTVLPETDPEAVEATGTLNSIVNVAPVDGHAMVVPSPDERMLSKAAENRAL